MRENIFKENAITLVALVITIIVLLILAGVTLSILLQTGIIENSQKAVNYYSYQYENEKDIIDYVDKKIFEVANGEKVSGYAINIKNAKKQKINNLIIHGDTLKDGTVLGNDGKIKLIITGKNMISDDKGNNEIEMKHMPDTSYGSYTYKVTSGNSHIVTDEENKIDFTISFLLQKYEDTPEDGELFNCIVFGGQSLGDMWAARFCEPSKYKQDIIDNNWIRFSRSQSIGAAREYQQSFIIFILEPQDKYQHIKVKNVQLEYGNEATEYEEYKEKVYEIDLKDIDGNTIYGLAKNEKIEKINDDWVICKEDNTMIKLNKDTNEILENIELFEGTSNIFIETNTPNLSGDYDGSTKLKSYIEFTYKN